MKKFLYGFVAALTVTLLVGCSSILNNNEGVFGKPKKPMMPLVPKLDL